MRVPVQQPIKLDPFREVRSPERNYGPARLAGGNVTTPLARRLAAQAGIDHGQLAPATTKGRIRARDVEAAIASGTRARQSPDRAATVDPQRIIALYEPGSFAEVALDNMRRTIATRLTEAVQTIPHFYLSIDLTTERLVEIREETNATAPKGSDGEASYRLSLNDFLIRLGGWLCGACQPPMRCGRMTGSCASRNQISELQCDGGRIADPCDPQRRC